MMQFLWRFFEFDRAPQVENAAIAVSRRCATIYEDAYGNRTTVLEDTTWSGNETAGPSMFQHNAAQQQQFMPTQHNDHPQAQRRAVPYHQPVVEGQGRVTAGLPLKRRAWDDDF